MQSHARSLGRVVLAAAIMAVAPGIPGLEAQEERVYDMSELDTQPSLKSPQRAAAAIDRSYPRRLRSQNVAGTVQLSFVVKMDGRVDNDTIEIVMTDVERLGEAARQAISRIRFNPGQVNGENVASRVNLPIVYRAR